MSAPSIVTNDNDYAVVINVVSAIRNKSTDRAAEEIASYRELLVKAERERVLAAIEASLDYEDHHPKLGVFAVIDNLRGER